LVPRGDEFRAHPYAAAVALLVRMISRNQRAVDEATSWRKRIIVTWVILNTLAILDALNKKNS